MNLPLHTRYIEQRNDPSGSYSYIINDSMNHTIAKIIMDSRASQLEKLVVANEIVNACNTIKICESKLADEHNKKEGLLSAAKTALAWIRGILNLASISIGQKTSCKEEEILVKAIEIAEKEE